MIEINITRQDVVEALLMNLKDLLGGKVFHTISIVITRDYLGDEMDLRTAIMNRPDLFERAFIGLTGDIGERILQHIWCSKLREQFDLQFEETYQVAGDLAKCIRAIPPKVDTGVH
jgi:hypothetical protein